MDVVTRSIVQAGLDATQYEAGARKIEQANQSLVRSTDAVVAAFHDAHERLYGYAFTDRPEQQVEWVNLRVTGVGPIRRPRLATLPARECAGPEPARRPVCFDAAAGYTDTPIHQRSALRPGDVVVGPAVIEEYGSTVPLHPGFSARVDDYGNLVVSR